MNNIKTSTELKKMLNPNYKPNPKTKTIYFYSDPFFIKLGIRTVKLFYNIFSVISLSHIVSLKMLFELMWSHFTEKY